MKRINIEASICICPFSKASELWDQIIIPLPSLFCILRLGAITLSIFPLHNYEPQLAHLVFRQNKCINLCWSRFAHLVFSILALHLKGDIVFFVFLNTFKSALMLRQRIKHCKDSISIISQGEEMIDARDLRGTHTPCWLFSSPPLYLGFFNRISDGFEYVLPPIV